MVVPLGSGEHVDGALAFAWVPERTEDFHGLDDSLPAAFAEQAALALQIARAREAQQRLALFEDRDRIGRDLHDLVIQRLFAVGLSLQSMSRMVDDAGLTERIDTAVADIDSTIGDIRRTIFALGSLGTSVDVQSEITRMVERAVATLKFRPDLRFEGPVRTLVRPEIVPDLLAVLVEALSNASRHAQATTVEVLVSVGDEVLLQVADNGRGFDHVVDESGIDNMRERALRHGGGFSVESATGKGTTVTWTVPITAGSPGPAPGQG
jgi:signal transduction histidine kinase